MEYLKIYRIFKSVLSVINYFAVERYAAKIRRKTKLDRQSDNTEEDKAVFTFFRGAIFVTIEPLI